MPRVLCHYWARIYECSDCLARTRPSKFRRPTLTRNFFRFRLYYWLSCINAYRYCAIEDQETTSKQKQQIYYGSRCFDETT